MRRRGFRGRVTRSGGVVSGRRAFAPRAVRKADLGWEALRAIAYESGTEHDHQVAFVAWCAFQVSRGWRELEAIFAVGNGGLRHPVVANAMRDEGVKPGIPDLLWPVQAERRRLRGLAIEMKAPREATGGIRRVSDDQRTWLLRFGLLGWCPGVAFGCDAAIGLVQWYSFDAIVLPKDGPVKMAETPYLERVQWVPPPSETERIIGVAIDLWRPYNPRSRTARGSASTPTPAGGTEEGSHA